MDVSGKHLNLCKKIPCYIHQKINNMEDPVSSRYKINSW